MHSNTHNWSHRSTQARLPHNNKKTTAKEMLLPKCLGSNEPDFAPKTQAEGMGVQGKKEDRRIEEAKEADSLEINDSTSKPLTSSISPQTFHQPTHQTKQQTNGTKALCLSLRLFINSLVVCLWDPPLQSLIWFLPPSVRRKKISFCQGRRKACHHPQCAIWSKKLTGLTNHSTQSLKWHADLRKMRDEASWWKQADWY